MSAISTEDAKKAFVGIVRNTLVLTLQILKTRSDRNLISKSVSEGYFFDEYRNEDIKRMSKLRKELIKCVDKFIDWSIQL